MVVELYGPECCLTHAPDRDMLICLPNPNYTHETFCEHQHIYRLHAHEVLLLLLAFTLFVPSEKASSCKRSRCEKNHGLVGEHYLQFFWSVWLPRTGGRTYYKRGFYLYCNGWDGEIICSTVCICKAKGIERCRTKSIIATCYESFSACFAWEP